MERAESPATRPTYGLLRRSSAIHRADPGLVDADRRTSVAIDAGSYDPGLQQRRRERRRTAVRHPGGAGSTLWL